MKHYLRNFLFASALGFSVANAQSFSVGGFAQSNPEYLSPTLETNFQSDTYTFGANLQRDAFGASVASALELGPAGRVSYGAELGLGFTGFRLGANARGTVGPVALEANLGYSNTARSNLWVFDNFGYSYAGQNLGAAQNWVGGFSARYRLSPFDTLGLVLEQQSAFALEGTLEKRSDKTLTLGAGYLNGFYGIAGIRTEIDEEGSLLTLKLRTGQRNQLEANLYQDDLKLGLTVSYPLAATVMVDMNPFRFDIGYNNGYFVGLRYNWIIESEDLEGEEE